MISMWRKHFSLFMFFVCDDARKNMCDRHRPANKQLKANKNHIKKSLTNSIIIINKMITVEYLTLHSGPEKIKDNFF